MVVVLEDCLMSPTAAGEVGRIMKHTCVFAAATFLLLFVAETCVLKGGGSSLSLLQAGGSLEGGLLFCKWQVTGGACRVVLM